VFVRVLFQSEENIREGIAFPRNGRAADVMSDAPSTVSDAQLFDLNIDVTSMD